MFVKAVQMKGLVSSLNKSGTVQIKMDYTNEKLGLFLTVRDLS